jgi:hypothetical protein
VAGAAKFSVVMELEHMLTYRFSTRRPLAGTEEVTARRPPAL